jgi:hypothetical protein
MPLFSHDKVFNNVRYKSSRSCSAMNRGQYSATQFNGNGTPPYTRGNDGSPPTKYDIGKKWDGIPLPPPIDDDDDDDDGNDETVTLFGGVTTMPTRVVDGNGFVGALAATALVSVFDVVVDDTTTEDDALSLLFVGVVSLPPLLAVLVLPLLGFDLPPRPPKELLILLIT